MPSIIFLNRFYWPDELATAQLLRDIAEAMAERGHEVVVITSRPENSGRLLPRSEHHHGVRIERVRSTRWWRRHLAGRAVDFATFHIAVLARLFWHLRREDTVVAMTDPPLLGVGAWLITRLRGARVVHWVQDIYPEIAIGVSGGRLLQAFQPVRNLSWRRSSACVVPGEDMAASITASGVPAERVIVSSNWAPAGLNPAAEAAIAAQRATWKLTGKFVAMYSGNLGRVHDLEPLLEVAATMQHDSDFALVIVGEGAQRPLLQQSARSRGLANMHFFPSQPRAALGTVLGAADVHFVTLRPGTAGFVFPSKLYGVARVERPVIFIGERTCELARIVETGRFGRTFDRTQIAAIATELSALKRQPERCTAMGAAAAVFAANGLPTAVALWDRVLRHGVVDSSEATEQIALP